MPFRRGDCRVAQYPKGSDFLGQASRPQGRLRFGQKTPETVSHIKILNSLNVLLETLVMPCLLLILFLAAVRKWVLLMLDQSAGCPNFTF